MQSINPDQDGGTLNILLSDGSLRSWGGMKHNLHTCLGGCYYNTHTTSKCVPCTPSVPLRLTDRVGSVGVAIMISTDAVVTRDLRVLWIGDKCSMMFSDYVGSGVPSRFEPLGCLYDLNDAVKTTHSSDSIVFFRGKGASY